MNAARPGKRSPRFRRVPFIRDVAQDPGRATEPRLSAPHMLPSTDENVSAPAILIIIVAHSHTPNNRCVRFIAVVTSHDATLTTRRALPLTRAGLTPAGTRQLGLAHLTQIVALQAWLADVLDRIADIPQRRLPELLPCNWKSRSDGKAA